MTPSEFDDLRRLLKQHSGLDLSRDTRGLAESRLSPLARREGFDDLDGLMRQVRAGQPRVIATVVEAMTTTETSFFRDRTPFAHLREMILPALLRARAARRSLRIWSAGSSTGQEPYSIAMCIKDFGASFDGWQTEIVASDLSQTALQKSEAGLFSQFEVQCGLPIHTLLKHFTPAGETPVGQVWKINPDIRAMVTHRPFNLLHDGASLGMFDVIFCRNVLMSFDQATRTSVLARLSQALHTDGYLMLGSADTIRHFTDPFTPHPDRRGLYRRDLRAPSLAPRLMPFKVVA